MPKLKTNSSAKKRFSLTSTGKVRLTQAGKRHGMRKRSKRSIRNQRAMVIAHDCTAKIVKRYMPYS